MNAICTCTGFNSSVAAVARSVSRTTGGHAGRTLNEGRADDAVVGGGSARVERRPAQLSAAAVGAAVLQRPRGRSGGPLGTGDCRSWLTRFEVHALSAAGARPRRATCDYRTIFRSVAAGRPGFFRTLRTIIFLAARDLFSRDTFPRRGRRRR